MQLVLRPQVPHMSVNLLMDLDEKKTDDWKAVKKHVLRGIYHMWKHIVSVVEKQVSGVW